MSKVAVVGAVVIIGIGVVGGGGYYYATNKAGQELKNTISLLEKSMPGSSIKYDSYSVSPFSQSATLNKVVLKDSKGQEYTADTVIFSGVSKEKLGSISIDKFHTSIEGGVIDVAHVDAKNVVAGSGAVVIEDGKIKHVFPSKVSFDLLNIQNLSAIGPDKTGVTVAQYQLNNYGIKQKSNQTLSQLEVKASPDGKENIKLNQAQIEGLDIAQIAAQLEQGQMPKAISGQPEKAVIEGLSANVGYQNWSLARFETENSVTADNNLKSTGNFTGFKIITANNMKLYPLKELGYNEIDASGNITGVYDQLKQQWSVAPFNVTVQNMGNFNAALKFNAPGDMSNVTPQELLSTYKVISFKIALQDQGLLQKVLDSNAKKQGVSVDQFKEQLITMIKQDEATATIPVQKQGDDAILQVINDPKKSIVIEMNPTTPVTAMELMGKSQADIFDILKLSIKAEASK